MIAQDLRFAFRTFRRSPGFAFAALSILALGIGIQTAAFSLLDAVVLRPLPGVQRPAELADLRAGGLSFPTYADLRQQSGVFDGLGAWGMRSFDLSARGAARRLRGGVVSGDYFKTLGVRAQRGRLLAPADEQSGATIAVLSDRLWHSAFGAAPSAVGGVLMLNGIPFTVVGVADPGFRGVGFGQPADLWIPIGSFRQTASGALARLDYRRRGWGWLSAFARLKSGVSLAHAQSALDPLVKRLAAADPGGALDGSPIPLQLLSRTAAGATNQASPARLLALLCGAVGLVLLVACANLANLLLGRALARRPEIAVRLALGAGRSRIGRQLLTESLLLALLGGAGGLFVAQWTLALALRTPLPGGESLESFAPGLDWRAFLVAIGVTLFTAVAFGLAPALQAARTEVVSALKQRSLSGARRGRLHGLLVASQVALCLVLLASAGLFLRSLQRALATDPGFQARGVAAASVELGLARYDAARANRFATDLADRVAAIPGVRATAWAGILPLSGDRNRETFTTDREPNRTQLAEIAAVGPGYFRTLRHPIVRGREFQASTERPADDVRAIIVNVAAARWLWPGEEAVGRRIRYGEIDATVVGVCADSLFVSLTDAHLPMLYVPMNQLGGDAVLSAMTLLVSTGRDAAALAGPIAAEVARLDPTLPVFGARTLEDITASQLLAQRVGGTLLGAFAVLSLVLSAVGIYGVVAAAAARRTSELALRLALGARPQDLRRRLLLEAAVPVGAGLAVGLALALAAGRLASRFLFGVTAGDVPTFLAAVLVLAGSALLASDLPARRVMRTDPMLALRTE